MNAYVLMLVLLGADAVTEYRQPLTVSSLDDKTLEAEGFGEKQALKREADGLHISVSPGQQETGWKTPQNLRVGGDFRIRAKLQILKLPRPAQEDGAAVGLAIAFGDVNQPDATLLRMREPDERDVYRPVDRNMIAQARAASDPNQQQAARGGAKPEKPPRRTFPAKDDVVWLELQREKNAVRFQVTDAKTNQTRYLGQSELGANDVAAVKLFVTNSSGGDPVEVVWSDFSIDADRLTGMGTTVRSVFGDVVFADPTSLEGNVLVIGGEPKQPPAEQKPDAPKTPEAGKDAAKKKAETKDAKEKKAQPPDPSGGPGSAANDAKPAVSEQSIAFASGKEVAKLVIAKESAPAPASPKAEPQPAAKQSPPKEGEPAKPADANQKNAAKKEEKKPKAKLPLDQVESIIFERPVKMEIKFLGQPNIDVTQPGLSAKKPGSDNKEAAAETNAFAPAPGTTIKIIPKISPKPNGIRDLHLWLTGLFDSKIKQITIQAQSDKGQTQYRLDTANSDAWPLELKRSGVEPTADLFLEPPPGDCHDKQFTITITYEDGKNGNANIKVDQHTNAELKIDSDKPTGRTPEATVYLVDGGKVAGKFHGITGDLLALTTSWQAELKIPLLHIRGIHMGLLDRRESADSFRTRLDSRGAEDILLAQTREDEVLAVPGQLEGTQGDRLQFLYKEQSRTLPLEKAEGMVLAARPGSEPDDLLFQVFSLLDGTQLSGKWKDLNTKEWSIETLWGQQINLPVEIVSSVRVRGGMMSYLSDLDPGAVEQVPFFSHQWSWRRDESLTGGPLKVAGRTYQRGIAVHSRCYLTYDLNGRFSTFETLVGFDEAASRHGRVECKILADGSEIFANPDLRADGDPVPVSLSVEGVQQLQLWVDFGQGADTGDRVIWAAARLYRQPPPKQATATETAAKTED